MVLAVLAIVIATVVAVYDREGSSTAGGTSDAATLELSEFALTPAALSVSVGARSR